VAVTGPFPPVGSTQRRRRRRDSAAVNRYHGAATATATAPSLTTPPLNVIAKHDTPWDHVDAACKKTNEPAGQLQQMLVR